MIYQTDISLTFTPNIKWKKPDKKVWTAMRRRMSQGRNLSVDIGWFRGNYHIGPDRGMGTTVLPTAQIAKWNEEGHAVGGMYGGGVMPSPPRQFIRVGFLHSIKSDRSTQELFVRLTQDVVEGRKTWKKAYSELGANLFIRLQKAIKMDIYEKNRPLTIALKGHAVTLIDTGQMMNSIEYRTNTRK